MHLGGLGLPCHATISHTRSPAKESMTKPTSEDLQACHPVSPSYTIVGGADHAQSGQSCAESEAMISAKWTKKTGVASARCPHVKVWQHNGERPQASSVATKAGDEIA
eukprot:6471850-Amphidinium_carterae.1